MGTLVNDLRIAVRRLRQRPGFTAVAVLTLALGLGANIAIFTLVHALMLRSLPVAHPEELYRLGDDDNCCVNSGLQREYSLFSYPLYLHLRDQASEFSELAAFQATTVPFGVRRSGEPYATSHPAQFVSANYFMMFGVRPAAGRLLMADDDRPGSPAAFVMSHRTWTRQYGRDRSVVGGAFLVNGTPMTLVGIAPPEFFGDTIRPNPAAIWIPVGQEPAVRGAGSVLARAESDWLYAIGRLRPGVGAAQVEAHVTAALRQWLLAQSFVTDANRDDVARAQVPVVPARGGVALMRITFARSLTILFATSGLVLLIASANLANLLLARADRGDAAIRAALGASIPRLIRQSLTEGVLLAVCGGFAGLIVAALGARALVAMAFQGAEFVPVAVTPAPAILLFALGLSVVTGAVFSAAPAWAMARTPPLEGLSGAGRTTNRRSFVPRRSLVVVQVTVSVVLLTGAGLLGRSLGNLERQPMGFTAENRVVVRLDPPPLAGQPDRLETFYARLQERLLRVPGVERVTCALYSPMEGNNWSGRISIEGRPVDPARPTGSSWNRVWPGYFETVGTRVLRGRAIGERDTPAGRRVAVVNAAFVRRFFEAADPIGRRLGIGDQSHAGDFDIVGVVEDVKYTAASQPVRPMIFLPALQLVEYASEAERSVQARSNLLRAVVLQTTLGAGSLEDQIRTAVAETDPNATVVRVVPMPDQVSANFRMNRLMARLTSAYGVLALLLASIGLYGVTAYAVTSRTREIGVRMALGANRADVVRAMLRGPLVQTAVGLILGAPLALVAVQAIATQLYGVEARDPFFLGGAMIALAVSAVVAAAVPAWRAASVDPTRALRAE
jgi:macrolide transport system ATP-binding/permease protein